MSQVPAAHVEVQGGPRSRLVSVMGMTCVSDLPFILGQFLCGNCDVRVACRNGQDQKMRFCSKEIGGLVVEFLEVKVWRSSTCDGVDVVCIFRSFLWILM